MADKLDVILEKLESLESRISAIERKFAMHTRPSTQLIVKKPRAEEPEYPYNPDFGR